MTADKFREDGKWNEYFLCHGEEFRDFWSDYFTSASRDILFLLGRGFDPRMNLGVKELLGYSGSGKRDCICIALDEGSESPSNRYKDRIDKNFKELEQIFNGKGSIRSRTVLMWADDNRRIGSRNAAEVIKNVEDLSQYTDIIVDISALPRNIFCPLITKIIRLLENNQKKYSKRSPNLHVIVSENPRLDRLIRSEGLEQEATYIRGFSGGLDLQSNKEKPRVWIPILGVGQIDKLRRIHTKVNPDEICPILPFPSVHPRRGDDLILEYREFLFDTLGVEIRNILYADERNPFDVYRQIRDTVIHYSNSLDPLGGCMAAVSALSSKLLSLGALLAAIELDIGMAQVESYGYAIVNENNLDEGIGDGELFEVWLAGEPYE